MSLRLKSSVGHNEKFTLQIFHSGEDQRGTAQNFGLFWTKISVFDEKTRFTYVKTNKKKHMSMEFKSSLGQNGSLNL